MMTKAALIMARKEDCGQDSIDKHSGIVGQCGQGSGGHSDARYVAVDMKTSSQ